MIDEYEKYKHLVQIPEHTTIPYHLHQTSISYQGKKSNIERFISMKKYKGQGVILDYHKPNSNILLIHQND